MRPLLAIEDLSDADWQCRWDEDASTAVRARSRARPAPPPPKTPTVREEFAEFFDRWRVVEADPGPFLSLGLRDAAWLERALPEILAAAESAPIDGDASCHLDVRSDNLCFRDGRAVLVDWNWASLANADVDIAAWRRACCRRRAAAVGGAARKRARSPPSSPVCWAAVAGLPPPETAPIVRELQRAQLAVALDWVDREL